MSKENKIIILAGKGESTNILFHSISKAYTVEQVILEKPIDKKTFLKRRIKKLGFITVFGQVIFQIIIVPVLKKMSSLRIVEIIK